MKKKPVFYANQTSVKLGDVVQLSDWACSQVELHSEVVLRTSVGVVRLIENQRCIGVQIDGRMFAVDPVNTVLVARFA